VEHPSACITLFKENALENLKKMTKKQLANMVAHINMQREPAGYNQMVQEPEPQKHEQPPRKRTRTTIKQPKTKYLVMPAGRKPDSGSSSSLESDSDAFYLDDSDHLMPDGETAIPSNAPLKFWKEDRRARGQQTKDEFYDSLFGYSEIPENSENSEDSEDLEDFIQSRFDLSPISSPTNRQT